MPPYASFNVGQIQGGTALNIIPRQCVFEFDYRPVPTDDVDAVIARLRDHAMREVLPRLKLGAPDGGIEIGSGSAHVPRPRAGAGGGRPRPWPAS